MHPTITPTNALQVFAYGEQMVRTIKRDNQDWFVAKDVCACLGIANSRDALTRLDNDEKGVGVSDTLGGKQEFAIVNEAGLYTIILRSQGAVTAGHPAHTFRRWVTHEVLPAIRKAGVYAAPQAQNNFAQFDVKMDRLLGVLESLVRSLPAMVRGKAVSKRTLYEADVERVKKMYAEGVRLDDISDATGFGKTGIYHVTQGNYRVVGGRVVIEDPHRVTRAAIKRELRANRHGDTRQQTFPDITISVGAMPGVD